MGRDEKEDTTTMSEVIGTREKWADAGEVTSVRIHILMPYDPATKRVCWGACIKWIT
jgi:ribosomal protein S28E/S33